MIYIKEIVNKQSPIQYGGFKINNSQSYETEITIIVDQPTFFSHGNILIDICLQTLEQEFGITKRELKEAYPEKFI